MSKRTRSIIELCLNIPALICLMVSIVCVTIQLAGGGLNSMWSTIPLCIATSLICTDGIFDIIYVKIGKDK
jgi:hypothetical protein